MAFQKGESGNPGGRPKEHGALRDLARAKSPEMLAVLISIAEDTTASLTSRVTAANSVLDRAWGKPATILGDGDGNAFDFVEILARARDRALGV